jgi:hypothetical protein
MVRALAAILLGVSLVSVVSFAQAKRGSSLLENRVTFSAPSAWSVKRHTSTGSSGRAELDIPTLNPDLRLPIATISASVTAPETTVKHLSESVYKNKYEGLAILSDSFDGQHWRTIVWTAKGEKQYLALQRFGVVNRVSVEVFIVCYLPAQENAAQLTKLLENFNAFCESLKIDGKNEFTNKLTLEKIAKNKTTP